MLLGDPYGVTYYNAKNLTYIGDLGVMLGHPSPRSRCNLPSRDCL
jgi:hypothetical protein